MTLTELIREAKFSPDGTRVATLSFEGTFNLWNSRTGTFLA